MIDRAGAARDRVRRSRDRTGSFRVDYVDGLGLRISTVLMPDAASSISAIPWFKSGLHCEKAALLTEDMRMPVRRPMTTRIR